MTTSAIWGHAPAERTKTKFGTRSRVTDVIMRFKFYRNHLRDFWAVSGQYGGFQLIYDLLQKYSSLYCTMTIIAKQRNLSTLPIAPVRGISSVTPLDTNFNSTGGRVLQWPGHIPVFLQIRHVSLVGAHRVCVLHVQYYIASFRNWNPSKATGVKNRRQMWDYILNPPL